MGGQLQALFQKFDLMLHVVAFVKDEINNLISIVKINYHDVIQWQSFH
jgi:hypothetical protein